MSETPIPGTTVFLMESLEVMPVGADCIAEWKATDSLLERVLQSVHHGWGDKYPDPGMKPFYL